MFSLYRQERAIFEFVDYAALLEECRAVKARTILEFGPGTSTLALVESGAERVVTCEYQDRWMDSARQLLKAYSHVSLHHFSNEIEVRVDGLSRKCFDLAFVDSPLGIEARSHTPIPGQEGCSRLNTLLYAIERAPVVLFHDARREGEMRSLQRIIDMGHIVEMIETPKGIARITRRPHPEMAAL